MGGLKGSRGGSNLPYLNAISGNFWQKGDVDTDSQFYLEEEYKTTEGEVKIRKGLAFGSVEGIFLKAWFADTKYGETVNIEIEIDENKYILAGKINDSYGRDMMKALLSIDPEKEVEFAPYDFVSKDDNKRKQGCTVYQEGKKVVLVPSPKESMGIEFKTAEEIKKMGLTARGKKQRQRYFEDQSEAIKQLVLESVPDLISEKKEEEETEKPKKTSKPKENKHLKVLKSLSDGEIPEEVLNDPELIEEWYELAVAGEDLPYEDYEEQPEDDDVPEDDDPDYSQTEDDDDPEDGDDDTSDNDEEVSDAVRKLRERRKQRQAKK
jgi:hypothetical protein